MKFKAGDQVRVVENADLEMLKSWALEGQQGVVSKVLYVDESDGTYILDDGCYYPEANLEPAN